MSEDRCPHCGMPKLQHTTGEMGLFRLYACNGWRWNDDDVVQSAACKALAAKESPIADLRRRAEIAERAAEHVAELWLHGHYESDCWSQWLELTTHYDCEADTALPWAYAWAEAEWEEER